MSDDGSSATKKSVISEERGSTFVRPLRAAFRPWPSSDTRWRLLLLALSAAGSIGTIMFLILGKNALALRFLLATLVVLVGLLIQAVGW
jgi:hypothetical protein